MANDLDTNAPRRETGASSQHQNADPHGHHREHRLRALMTALQTGPIDAARFAFTALVNQDLELMQHPALAQIGSALQSSNLSAALRLASDMQSGPMPAFKDLQIQLRISDPTPTKNAAPRGFIGGLRGRLFGLSA